MKRRFLMLSAVLVVFGSGSTVLAQNQPSSSDLLAEQPFAENVFTKEHCWHHHPNHHRTVNGATQHHFHESHDWSNSNNSLWGLFPDAHYCIRW
jgi:hypothetical protein